MRRFFSFVLALCILAAFTGCSNRQTDAFSEKDLLLNVDGHEYRCRVNIETVIADLGEDYDYAEGKSCDYDGLDKIFTFAQAEFYTNPLSEGDLVSEIYSNSDTVSTSKGIQVGATKDDVASAYGEPAEDDGYLMIYRLSGEIGEPSLCFEMESGIVAAIFLTMEQV